MNETRFVYYTPSGWAVSTTAGGPPIAVHASQQTALTHAERDLAGTRAGGTIHISETGGPGRTIPIVGTDGTVGERAGAKWEKYAPWVALLLPGLITRIFGPMAPSLFAPGLIDESSSIWGAVAATFAWSAAIAALTWAALSGLQASWIGWCFLAIGLFALANAIAWWLNLGAFGDSALIPLPTDARFPQMIFSWFGVLILAGANAYGWGGLVVATAAGIIAGWQASEKWKYKF